MIDEENRTVVETHMLTQAGSLGALVEQFRDRIPPALIDGAGWDRLLERARALPVSLGAFGFGFELPLHLPEPRADLGVGLFEGSRSAAHFLEWCRSRGADSSTAAPVRLLREMGREGSGLRRIAGTRLLLEYDIDPAHRGAPPDPGLFLYPAADALPGDGSARQVADLGVVTGAMAAACGWEPDAAERAHIERVYLAAAAGTYIGTVGAFPSRDRAIRLTATGFRKTGAVMGFLERAGWPGPRATVASTLSHLEDRGAFARVGVHFDVSARGVGATLGLSFFAGEQEWFAGEGERLNDIRHWTPLIDGLRELRLAVPEKLSALTGSSTGAETLFGKSAPFVLMRGIHHVKLVVAGDRIDQAKAYVFNLFFGLPPRAGKDSGS